MKTGANGEKSIHICYLRNRISHISYGRLVPAGILVKSVFRCFYGCTTFFKTATGDTPANTYQGAQRGISEGYATHFKCELQICKLSYTCIAILTWSHKLWQVAKQTVDVSGPRVYCSYCEIPSCSELWEIIWKKNVNVFLYHYFQLSLTRLALSAEPLPRYLGLCMSVHP